MQNEPQLIVRVQGIFYVATWKPDSIILYTSATPIHPHRVTSFGVDSICVYAEQEMAAYQKFYTAVVSQAAKIGAHYACLSSAKPQANMNQSTWEISDTINMYVRKKRFGF